MGKNDKFVLDVSQFVTESEKDMLNLKKKVALTLFTRIINRSPVDEGTFRANWYVTTSRPSSAYKPKAKDVDGQVTIERMKDRVEKIDDPSKPIIMANNSPYGDMLEYGLYPKNPKNPTGKTINGYSAQAPLGMVGISIAEVSNLRIKE